MCLKVHLSYSNYEKLFLSWICKRNKNVIHYIILRTTRSHINRYSRKSDLNIIFAYLSDITQWNSFTFSNLCSLIFCLIVILGSVKKLGVTHIVTNVWVMRPIIKLFYQKMERCAFDEYFFLEKSVKEYLIWWRDDNDNDVHVYLYDTFREIIFKYKYPLLSSRKFSFQINIFHNFQSPRKIWLNSKVIFQPTNRHIIHIICNFMYRVSSMTWFPTLRGEIVD